MANIKDIAKLAGVSKSTVSRVVSNNGFVKEETRAKILKVMSDLNYRPNLFAKGMRTNKSQSIGILFPDLANPFFSEWYETFERISRTNGYFNYICISDPNGETEERIVDDLLARNIDGIVLFSYTKREAWWRRLAKISKHTPVICCDSMFDGFDLNCVFADGEQGTKKATNYLLSMGKKRIAYIKGFSNFEVVNRRFQGYRMALIESAISMDEELVIEADFTKESGYKAAQKLMGLKNRPDAIMASTDYMALGVLDFLRENKYDIPGDVAVFGFDNLEISRTSNPPLSTIGMPITEMASTTINKLVELLKEPKSPKVTEVFECTIINRETTE